MKDIHTHLLPAIDDGAKDLEQSKNLLKKLEDFGTTEIVLTPHYIDKSNYTSNVKNNKKLLKELQKYTNIKLYLGNEIYISENILQLLKDKELTTINNSKYLLIELPVINLLNNYKNVFSELICSGYKIILAHPERYIYVMNDIHFLDDLINMGIIMQGDYMSLFDKYGKKSKKTLKQLLKKGYISLLASDTHHSVKIDEKKLRMKLKKYVKKNEIEDLLNNNFDKIINNKDL